MQTSKNHRVLDPEYEVSCSLREPTKCSLREPTKWPPMLNMAPAGFKPGIMTSSFYLCPGNVEYWLADKLAPRFWAIGLGPNEVTAINCIFIRGPSLYLLRNGYFPLFILALLTAQVLDCLDGQIARHYKCGSAFGAWLDHTTDMVYGLSIALVTLQMIFLTQGLSKTFFAALGQSVTIGFFGSCAMRVKEEGTHWSQLTSVETVGVVQEWFMSYIFIGMYGSLYFLI